MKPAAEAPLSAVALFTVPPFESEFVFLVLIAPAVRLQILLKLQREGHRSVRSCAMS
jgi:hypothetical protein